MDTSLFDAFGVESPTADTKAIPLARVVKMGTTESEPDPHFQFQYRPLRRALRNIAECRPTWCWGPSGCGKTEFFIQIAKRLKRPIHVISFGEETSMRDLLGSFSLTSNENGNGFQTEFRYGQLAKAIQDPLAIVDLDEFNMAPAGVSSQLNRLLEAGEIHVHETGETIRVAEGTTFVVTANTPGGMDETGLYAGSQAQNGATRTRFQGLKMNYLPAELEERIVRFAAPRLDAEVQLPDSKRMASSLLVETGNMIRGLVDDGRVSLPFTVRQLKSWADATIKLKDLRDAFCDAYFDLLTPSEAEPVSEVFHKVFGLRPAE